MTTQDPFPFDVFISYSHQDKAWVRAELLTRLEAAGLKVFIDFRDIRTLEPMAREMERAVRTSRRTLLVLTPDYLKSGWTELESLMAQALDPAGRQGRVVPVLYRSCDVPLRIGCFKYVDFTDPAGEAIAWRQLLTALGTPPLPDVPDVVTPASWFLPHPFAMPPSFTGRLSERAMLDQWLTDDARHPLLVLEALGGFGKSALAWHWLTHDRPMALCPRLVWWSFYEGDNQFDAFLPRTLAYLGADLARFPGPRLQADELLRRLREPGTLLVLDGFERALRAYATMMAPYLDDGLPPEQGSPTDCTSAAAEYFLRALCLVPGIRAKVLMTTRLVPRVLETRSGELLAGCRLETLTQLHPADAQQFFRTRGVRGTRAEIEAACEPYGYHPLSLCLVAGLIVRDLREPGDVAAAQRLDVSGDLIQRQHHVLEVAYESLPPAQRLLLGRIACFRFPVTYDTLCDAAQTGKKKAKEDFDAQVRDLIDRGLLHHDRHTSRYDLHPIVRRYAYDRLTGAQRSAAHEHLRNYFAAVEKPRRVKTLEELAPVIELYHHTVRAGHYDDAFTLFRDRISNAIYYQFGAYQLHLDLLRALFPDGEDKPPRLKHERAQAWTLNALANTYSLSGQPRRAVPLLDVANAIDDKGADKTNLAIGLGNLAIQHVLIGSLRAAEANLRRRIDLCRDAEDEFNEAVGHQELGRLMAYRGRGAEAEEELARSTGFWEKTRDTQGVCLDEAYRAFRALLMARGSPEEADVHGLLDSAVAAARRALELADETARTRHPVERDYVRAHWLLGAAHRAKGDQEAAERHLGEALTRCRSINLVEVEADILLDLARLRRDQGERDEAWRLAEEALGITERCGYVLQGADVRLLLARLGLEAGDRAAALSHAHQARDLAACDGPPDYTYKVAYDEALALLCELEH